MDRVLASGNRATRMLVALLLVASGCPRGGTIRETSAPPATSVAGPPPATQPDDDIQPYALTISGGVSLGAYEAGLNWAVLELLSTATDRRMELRGVTGASAGSINALLTAMRWCQERGKDVEHNLFAETWRPIGLDDLMPADPDDYAISGAADAVPADLVMSRKRAFKAILAVVGAELTTGTGYRDCDLKLGMTVTSKEKRSLEVNKLTVGNQRFVVPFEVHGTPTGIEFFVDTSIPNNARKDLVGNLLFLTPDHIVPVDGRPGEYRYVVDAPRLMQVALASSAFPGAFGPVELDHCVPEAACPAQRWKPNDRCAQLGRELRFDAVAGQCRQTFIDGGVFDNVPLGVAMAQLETGIDPAPGDLRHRPLRYLYMYYDNRRDMPERTATHEPVPPPRPLSDTLETMGNVVSTATNYELHNVLRYNAWNAGVSRQARLAAHLLDGRPLEEVPASVPPAGVDTSDGLAWTLRTSARELDRAALPRMRDAYLAKRAETLTSIGQACDMVEKRNVACPPREAIAMLENDVRNERELQLTRRFSPLAGMHATHFGAFLDRPLRDYDYYAGVYDALVGEAQRACAIDSKSAIRLDDNQMQQQAQQAPPPPRPATGAREACDEEAAFKDARKRIGITGGDALAVTDALWAAEHEKPIQYPAGEVGKVMAALLAAGRCGKVPTTSRGLCLHDLDLEAFLTALEDNDYRPRRDAEFMRWAMHRASSWWLLPAARAAERVAELGEREGRGSIGFAGALAASVLGSEVAQGEDAGIVAPSSVPRRFGFLARAAFPFLAFSVEPARRLELGVLRAGLRFGRVDLLGDASMRVTVAEPTEDPAMDEGDVGYGLFTRGATVPSLSATLAFRFGHPILTTLGLRGGYPIEVANLGPPSFDAGDQANTELVATLLGDKLRFAVGCHPDANDADGFGDASEHCARHLYYSFGVNDLAGIAYWTGLNPFELDRLALPYILGRTNLEGEARAVDIGLLRAGWQLGRWFGAWGDTSLVAYPGDDDSQADVTINGNASLEAAPSWGLVERFGLRGGFPLTLREDARVSDGTAELFTVFRRGLRVAIGVFAGLEEVDPLWRERIYVSIGWDPGSILLSAAREFQSR